MSEVHDWFYVLVFFSEPNFEFILYAATSFKTGKLATTATSWTAVAGHATCNPFSSNVTSAQAVSCWLLDHVIYLNLRRK